MINTRTFAAMAALALLASPAMARQLSPDEALQTVKGGNTALRMPAKQMTLQLTRTSGADKTLYVFAPDGQPGFLIVAADSSAEKMLLGYSDNATFDPTDIPPQMQWWLSKASATVASQIKGGGPAILKMPDTRASRSDIAPLCQTKWNQTAPYYNSCPTIGGKRCVTGCVATAMAQVMKYHEWPDTGSGQKSYSWDYNGSTYSTSFNFGSTTFDWNNMLNTYGSSATTAQKNAVATLMSACGVASEMGYTPVESGTSPGIAGAGMIKYLKYDPSMLYLAREWYTAAQWDELMYDELTEGHPILYCGRNSANEGHEFVCDGYQTSDGLYHINWGWGGVSDGYFELASLDPDALGTGGGSGSSGFAYDQSVLIGVKPADGNTTSVVPVMALGSSLATDATSYSRTSSANITFTGGFYSFALGTVSGYSVGLALKGDDVDTVLHILNADDLDTYYGYSSFRISANKFPVGEYVVYPVFKTAGTDWQPLKYDIANCTNGKQFTVTSSNVTVGDSVAVNTDTGETETPTTVTLDKVSYAPANPNYPDFTAGYTYTFSATISATGPWEKPTAVFICDTDWYVQASSEYKTVTFSEAGTLTETFSIDIPDTFEGDYYLVVGYSDGSSLHSLGAYNMQIAAAPGTVDVSDLDFEGTEAQGNDAENPATILAAAQAITLNMNCTRAPFNDEVYLAFYLPSATRAEGEPVAYSESVPVSRTETGPFSVTFTGPWDGIEANTVYAIAPFSKKDGQIGSKLYYFMIDSPTGIIRLLDQTDAIYFNLKGERVANPEKGQIYLMQRGGKTVKVVK